MEKSHRFKEVQTQELGLTRIVESFSSATGSSSHFTLVSREDPRQLVINNRRLSFLKHHLESWKLEIQNLRSHCSDFATEMPHPSSPCTRLALLDASEYLSRLENEYDTTIRKCDTAVHDASLGFQMVRNHSICDKQNLTNDA